MKKLFTIVVLALACLSASAQGKYASEVVYKGDDITFLKIDGHTWHGYGKMVYNETVYIVEGSKKALVIDAGTNIQNLDQIVASITSKPVILVATHLHGDHTGSAINDFDEIWFYPVDEATENQNLKNYKGKKNSLKDGMVFDLGDRNITVFHTPGHTEGSVTYIDFKNHYGFSGDSFGNTDLLLGTTISGFRASCLKMLDIMKRNNIELLYPGHSAGDYCETQASIQNEIEMCDGLLNGSLKGEKGNRGLILTINGQRLEYSESQVK